MQPFSLLPSLGGHIVELDEIYNPPILGQFEEEDAKTFECLISVCLPCNLSISQHVWKVLSGEVLYAIPQLLGDSLLFFLVEYQFLNR